MTEKPNNLEPCPSCGASSLLRQKLILIDEAWVPATSKDPRTEYFTDLRVDDVKAENLRDHPLQQFVDGFYCDQCKKEFIPDGIIPQMDIDRALSEFRGAQISSLCRAVRPSRLGFGQYDIQQ